MRWFLIEETGNNEIIDFTNNIERLRKMRGLNIKAINERNSYRSKLLSLGSKIKFYNSSDRRKDIK